MIPGAKVGLIIGKNGKTIKQLQEQTGAKMVVIQDGPNENSFKVGLNYVLYLYIFLLNYELAEDFSSSGLI